MSGSLKRTAVSEPILLKTNLLVKANPLISLPRGLGLAWNRSPREVSEQPLSLV
jgi:hypothetical protein